MTSLHHSYFTFKYENLLHNLGESLRVTVCSREAVDVCTLWSPGRGNRPDPDDGLSVSASAMVNLE